MTHILLEPEGVEGLIRVLVLNRQRRLRKWTLVVRGGFNVKYEGL